MFADTGKKANTLVSHGAINVLLQTLVYESKEPNCSDELLVSIHQVLSKLGPKGRYTFSTNPALLHIREKSENLNLKQFLGKFIVWMTKIKENQRI